ncbi:unnamed protein product [Thelazia callipaeda]|uniref:MRP-L46 domain-containing protein n=1 Tax=Thelazia callipaeda TaxID=103827 RepID=A0A0N5D7U2_THECL|nr:unnamed protein product [Thelazia callipaeda]
MYHFPRFYSSLATTSERCIHSRTWEIFASVALFRPPIIAPRMNEIEQRYHSLMLQKELEDSLRCDFELRQLRDERLLKEKEKLKMSGEGGIIKEEIGILASVDEENWQKEASRIRDELSIGNISMFENDDDKSLMRKIDESLVFITCQKFGREDGYRSQWMLPQLRNIPGESLKQAKRCLKDFFLDRIHVEGLSNAPFSVFSYLYPAKLRQRLRTRSKGAVIFFFKAFCTTCVPLRINKEEIADYKWVTAEEFVANMKHTKSYITALSTLFPPYIMTKDGFQSEETVLPQKRKMSLSKVNHKSLRTYKV